MRHGRLQSLGTYLGGYWRGTVPICDVVLVVAVVVMFDGTGSSTPSQLTMANMKDAYPAASTRRSPRHGPHPSNYLRPRVVVQGLDFLPNMKSSLTITNTRYGDMHASL
jgi:hypothetical protein